VSGRIIIVVGGQWGSEAKGAVAGHLASELSFEAEATHRPPPIFARVGGPNAGHSKVDSTGHTWKFRQFPTGAVVNRDSPLVIAQGSEIDPPVLAEELRELDEAGYHATERLLVDGQCTVIEDRHKELETGGKAHGEAGITASLGSTGKGVGAARADRAMRSAKIWGDDNPKIETDVFMQNALREGSDVLLEAAQGYGLGLHCGLYPKCLHESTMVTTPEGPRRISDLRVGDRVWDEIGFTTVKNIWPSVKRAWQVRVGSRDLIVSGDHRHLVWNPRQKGEATEVCTADLQVGQQMRTPIFPIRGTKETLLSRGSTQGLSRRAGLRGDPETTPVLDWLYLAGYLVGDGWVTDTAIGKNRFVTWRGNDVSTVEAALGRLGFSASRSTSEDEAGCVKTRSFSNVLTEQFVRSGMRQPAPNKGLPEGFERLSESAMAVLLAGIIDSDGTLVHTKRGTRISVRTTSLYLGQQLQYWFDNHDLPTVARYLSKPEGGVLNGERVNWDRPMYRWEAVLDERFAEMIGLLNSWSRKTRLQPIVAGKVRKIAAGPTKYSRRSFRSSGRSVVTAVRDLGFEQPMIDIETESGRFVAGGVLTHNCTSADGRAIDVLHDAALSPWAPYVSALEVWVVLRVYPIRVAGNSGPLKNETTWSALGLPDEYTTVTLKRRRVGQWDPELAKAAVQANGETVNVAMTMLDQKFSALAGKSVLDSEAIDWLKERQDEIGAPIRLVGTGPGCHFRVEL
jgi:adenylosuccinate synthase